MNPYGFHQLPFAPFLHNAEDVILFFFVLLRVFGLFLSAPLISNANIPRTVRAIIPFFIAALITMVIYPDYRGENAIFELREFNIDTKGLILMIVFTASQEFFIGIIIGFCFSLILESLLFAGQSASHLMNLSLSELLDPVSGTSQTLIAQLFILMATVILFSLDLHHTFFRVVSESYRTLPIGSYNFSHESLDTILHGSQRVWHYALKYVAIPYVILFLITFGLGFMAKIMPEMNIFMVGMPLKIFIGYYTLILAVGFFPIVLQKAFVEYENLAHKIVIQMNSG